jgi:RNA polymerase sigma-70 factor (ECF subfamily)
MENDGQLTDSDLIRASVDDPAAFEVLFGRHAARLQTWLARETGDLAVANDLSAETFAQAWRSRRRFSGAEPGAGTAWLYGIARNLLRQHFKRGRVETAARQRLGMSLQQRCGDDFDLVVERLDAEADASSLRVALESVPEPQRRAIRGRVVEGRTYEEIARELACSTDNARAYVSRGLRSLNLILKGHDQ